MAKNRSKLALSLLIDGKPDEDGGAGIVPLLRCGLLLRWILLGSGKARRPNMARTAGCVVPLLKFLLAFIIDLSLLVIIGSTGMAVTGWGRKTLLPA